MNEFVDTSSDPSRTRGLWNATGVGVGAIVGGGILALAGVAFATTGPSAIVAFTANGVIALLTVLSFSELAARFPESGGTYTYARKVLTVEAAFGVGWVVWFASIVAAVLYALGFAAFFVPMIDGIWRAAGGEPPAWFGARFSLLAIALAATAFYGWSLSRSKAGGGQWETIGKVAVFLIVIGAGAWVLVTRPPTVEQMRGSVQPFLTGGLSGLVQAMGYTFIALQGFDLIAAVGGEVRRPERNIPRAMFLSLGIALAIYLPLLTLIILIGTGGEPVAEMAARSPETLVADAARNFLGPVGFWLMIVAGVLSMLSALQANLLAASRFAQTMARDRTLPRRFGQLDEARGTPVAAIVLTSGAIAIILVAVPDVAAAGATSSLIFLVSFGLVHVIAFLARRRSRRLGPFSTPWFPAVPFVGGGACLALALFQGLAVPSAGVLAALWLSLGAVLYATRLAPRARVVDASAEARNPELVRLRGRNPLTLVPIANPASAVGMMTVAHALSPTQFSRVLLLSVIQPPESWPPGEIPRPVADAQSVLGGALSTAMAAGLTPEALVTVGDDPWAEIGRVSRRYACETLLLGLGHLTEHLMTGPLEQLVGSVDCAVVILRAPPAWDLDSARRLLVPSGGRRDQSDPRARLLGNLCRSGEREVTYLGVLPRSANAAAVDRSRRDLSLLAEDEAPGESRVEVTRADDVASELVARSEETDLIILGLRRLSKRETVFGDLVIAVARATTCPLLLISRR